MLLKDVVTFEGTLIQDLTGVGHVLLFDHRYDSPDAVVIKFHNATQELGRRSSINSGGGALGVNLSCSGSRFNKTITGQQNMFNVGALEASFCKVDSNAAGAIPFLPSSQPF